MEEPAAIASRVREDEQAAACFHEAVMLLKGFHLPRLCK
jgi:hypothetical protein